MTASLAQQLFELCNRRGLVLATAESCTGGMVAAAITDIAGSSAIFDRGFVTYSNEAKTDLLGVKDETLVAYGAVSCETAIEMAAGALARSRADIAVSVTGIAGPGGATPGKPVGLVWFGVACKGVEPAAHERRFGELGRAEVRMRARDVALDLLIEAVER